MDEETTTPTPDDAGDDTSQPVDQGQVAAEPETDKEQDQPNQEPSEDEQLSEWAKNKGLELDSDNVKKAAQMAWNAEKRMHETTKQKSELEKTLGSTSDEVAEQIADSTGQDPELLKRLQRVEVKDAVRDFWDSHPEARSQETEMIEELQKSPHLAGDLEALYAKVLMRDTGAVKSQAKRDALQGLAQKQQAAVPQGNAVHSGGATSPRITPENVDALVAKNSQQWFVDNYDDINKAMSA